jgi:hypothetical protein
VNRCDGDVLTEVSTSIWPRLSTNSKIERADSGRSAESWSTSCWPARVSMHLPQILLPTSGTGGGQSARFADERAIVEAQHQFRTADTMQYPHDCCSDLAPSGAVGGGTSSGDFLTRVDALQRITVPSTRWLCRRGCGDVNSPPTPPVLRPATPTRGRLRNAAHVPRTASAGAGRRTARGPGWLGAGSSGSGTGPRSEGDTNATQPGRNLSSGTR